MRSIRETVYVTHPETFEALTLTPGTSEADVPSWAVDGMGAHVWDDSPIHDDRTELIAARLRAEGAQEWMLDLVREGLTDEESINAALVGTADVVTLREAITEANRRAEELGRPPTREDLEGAEVEHVNMGGNEPAPEPEPEPPAAKVAEPAKPKSPKVKP